MVKKFVFRDGDSFTSYEIIADGSHSVALELNSNMPDWDDPDDKQERTTCAISLGKQDILDLINDLIKVYGTIKE